MNLDKDTVIGGRYRVVEQIGIGGMSVVYRCKDEKLGRDVTVKILKDTYSKDEKFKHKFKTEAYSIAKLSHPNIVNVYDSGEEAGVCYIVMEYVDGMTLKEVIDEQAPLSSVTVLSIASQISSALMHAHKNHIVHRDIKPQNILVAYDGTIKVTDFGIAKGVSEDTLTAKSDSLGSVYYLSPEQARGGYVDERSDIYSLGITMYEMITGELPFDGDNSVNVAIKHMSEELPDIEEINPDADELLQQIIYKATNKKADERYANVTLMNEDIVTALSDIANGTSYVPEDDYDEDDYYDDEYDDDDYYEEEIRKPKKEKRKSDGYEEDETERKVVIAAVITALVIIAIISVFGYKAFFGTGKTEVPNLVGMELESAKLEAAGKNLSLVVDEQGYSDEYDKGIVYEQSKHSGSKVKENSEIKVSVSLGKNNGETPDFLYMDKNEAVTAIKGLTGKEPEITEVYDDTIPEGLVCEQYPEVGSNFEKDTKFKITISKGSEVTTTTVPRITGMSVDKAEKALEEAYLSIGKVSRSYSDSAPIDTIISQAVSSGEVVERDSKVDVVISKGKLVYIPVAGETTTSGNDDSSSDNSGSESTTPVIGTDEPETETNTNKSGTLSFNVSLPAGVSGSVAVKLVKIENGSSVSEVYSNTVEETDFPFNVNVTGTGNAEVQLYINDSYQWSQYVNFSEGGN